MRLSPWCQVLVSALLVSAELPTRTLTKRATPAPSNFVTTTSDGQFLFNNSIIDFVGTNAYWLSSLNSDEDIDSTLGNISATGIRVVRTWAFNDVETIPEDGTWFQLIANGTTSVNDGPNGLQKLDTVVRLAEKHGIFLVLSLTNNWNPRPLLDSTHPLAITPRDVTPGTNNSLPRGTLSNDYGGMDVYVRQFGDATMHDEFYRNQKIIDIFNNYTTQIVTRYVNSPAIFAWELANDPRCNSTLPATNNCNTQTITKWHSTVAQHVKSKDPNHLVSSGNQGFLCPDCKKLFATPAPSPPPRPPPPPPPPPQPSPRPGQRRSKVLTKRRIMEERKATLKKIRELKKRNNLVAGGLRIRGRWVATAEMKRQIQDMGPAFDGSQGVDSEDLLAIPQIGFGTFQLFPDQFKYGIDDPNLPAFNNTVEQGINWIQQHAAMGKLFGKPVTLNGFGLVTQDNAPFFIPFNQTQAPFASDNSTAPTPVQAPFGVTDQQRDDAYTQWLLAGLQAGLQGMIQYQWSQGNLTTSPGTLVSPPVDGPGTAPIVDGPGLSPNDGYAAQGQAQQTVNDVISQAAAQFASDSSSRR